MALSPKTLWSACFALGILAGCMATTDIDRDEIPNEERNVGAAGAAGAAGANSESGAAGQGGARDPGEAANDTVAPWNWVGIVGTGQSLAVGTTPYASTKQPYHNLMLSLADVDVPPWDSENSALKMIPLIEVREGRFHKGNPARYPTNLWGETPHSAMANQITALVGQEPGGDYVTVHSVVGESGQSMVALKKQADDVDYTDPETPRAYAATLFEARAISRLAAAEGKTYGIGAIVMTHGETDSGSGAYKGELVQLSKDYNADLSAITGQTQKIPMYISQQHAFPNGEEDNRAISLGQRPIANQAQWQLGVERPEEFVCTGPKYQYPVGPNEDGVHLSSVGYQMLGEKTAQVYYEREVLENDWQPLHPIEAKRSGRVVTVTFHVPVPPLEWDESLDEPAISEWVNGRGFELFQGNTTRIAIESVEISGESVEITAGADLPEDNLNVGYALASQGVQMNAASKAVRWGQLRDSDPFAGSFTKQPNPNYCVSFQMPVE